MHIIRVRYFLLIPLLLALSACALPPHSLPIGKPIPPGYLYKAKFLNIRSPDAEGWYLDGATQSGMQFVYRGAEKGGTLIAQVSTFPLPKFRKADAFLDFIKHSFHDDTQQKQVASVKSSFNIDSARKYLCVKVSAVIKEKRALTASKSHGKLLLQSVSLYCRHPVNTLAGFAIIYSHRGPSLYPGLTKKANAFIAGVQVPGY